MGKYYDCFERLDTIDAYMLIAQINELHMWQLVHILKHVL